MYRITSTAGLDQHTSNAPDALDTLHEHLREQLLDAAQRTHIDWVITPPTGQPLTGWITTPGGDPMLETNLDVLHHSLVHDFAIALFEASRQVPPAA